MRKIIVLLLICSIVPGFLKAQSQKLLQSKWVKIMQNETGGNYFEAENDFQKFYSSYIKKEIKNTNERNHGSPGEQHLEDPEELLIAGYLKWSTAIKPFVRADGSIMPIEERLAIINDAKKAQQQK